MRHLHEKRRRTHPSRAPGTDAGAVSGPAQFRVRTPEGSLACSSNVGATRLDRFDSLPGSIGTLEFGI
eukprot:12945306-Alexandrium_andersonii.AAC.1